MDVVGAAALGVLVVLLAATFVGSRGLRRRRRRVPMGEQSDWTSGGDGSL